MRSVLPLVLILTAASAAAAEPRLISPADYGSVATATEVAVSPDGSMIAYCLATWDEKADNRRTDLWVVPTDGKGTPRKLTSDRANDRHPKWAADGSGVYVLRNVKGADETAPPTDGSTQVWRVKVDGESAPAAVTRVKGGVVGFDLAPAANAVFYSTDAEATDPDDFLKLRERYPKVEYGHGRRKVSELFRLPSAGGVAVKVVAEKRYVREFTVTADGKRIAMISAPDDTVVRSEGDSRVDVWDAATKAVTVTDQGWKRTAASPWPWLEGLAWDEIGERLAYCTIFDAHPAEIIACRLRDGAWESERLPRGNHFQIRGYGSPLRWLKHALYFVTDQAGANDIRTWSPARPGQFGGGNVLAGPGAVIYAFDIGRVGEMRGRLAGVRGGPDGLAEVVGSGPSGRVTLTHLNPQAKGWLMPTVEHVTWKAPDGGTVGGALELPANYEKGARKLPLVVAIHGGPTTSSTAALQFDPHNGRLYFAAAGYAVLAPNYRGSTGYGDKFTTDLIGRENDLDVKDIVAGIQHLVDAGIADPDRIAVMGWSNGGYLTNCLIAMPDPPVRIRAASSGAGILDSVAEWGFNDEPAYPRVFKTGLPWERPEVYRRTSPTYQLGNVKTPTLIHVGANDERCPPGHSRMLYRALRENLGVPTQLCVYPGEPHGLGKLSHRRAKMEWDLAWFGRYLRRE